MCSRMKYALGILSKTAVYLVHKSSLISHGSVGLVSLSQSQQVAETNLQPDLAPLLVNPNPQVLSSIR